jgi:DNA-binding HxlR family transcriptional regulator
MISLKYVRGDECPARAVLGRVGDRWSMLVLNELRNGPQRFGQLLTSLPGSVQPKVLSETLVRLERDGFITREVCDTRPPHVVYHLSELGESLLQPVRLLAEWALAHNSAIERSRRMYDHRTAGSDPSGVARLA